MSDIATLSHIVSGGGWIAGIAALAAVIFRSKKDTNKSNLDYIREWSAQVSEREAYWTTQFDKQNDRMFDMNSQLGEFKGRLLQALEHIGVKDAEIASLRAELARVVAEQISERAAAVAAIAAAKQIPSPHPARKTDLIDPNIKGIMT